jgi:hypothetical protein
MLDPDYWPQGKSALRLLMNEGAGSPKDAASRVAWAINGGVAWQPSQRGQTTHYDGTGYLLGPSVIKGTEPGLTIAAWINLDTKTATAGLNPAVGNVIFGGATSPSNHALIFSITSTKLSFYSDELLSVGNSASISYNVGEWHHAAVTIDNSSFVTKHYFDAEDVSGSNNTVAPVAHVNNSVALDAVNNQLFTGLIDNLIVLPYVLSAGQIAALYANPYADVLPSVVQRFYGAAVVSGFQPAWAANANSLIGGGIAA